MKKITLIAMTATWLVNAQTDTNPPPPVGIIEKTVDTLTSVQNYSVNLYGTYATDQEKIGGGVLALYNVNDYVGLGIGGDYLGEFSMVSGQFALKLPTHPLAFLGATNLTATMFSHVGIGTPIGGAGPENGGVSTIAGVGIMLDVFKWKGFQFSAGYSHSVWSGAGKFTGPREHVIFGGRKGF